MISRSERLLQNWKGAQPILKYRKRYQIPILFGFAFTVYISLFGGLATGNIILAGMGILSAGIYAFLFITVTNVIRSRSKEEKQLRMKQERMKEIIDAVTEYDQDRNDVRLQDLKTKIVTYIEDLPDELKNESIDPTKVYLAIDKAEESLQQVRELKTLQDEDRKKINETIHEVMRQLSINRIAFTKTYNLKVESERERDQLRQEKDNEIKKLRIELETAVTSISTDKIKIAELEKRIKDLEAK